jgi:transcriptional regulator with XRE-family HTH domain
MAKADPWQAHLDALGEFIRSQRRLANLSLRELAARTHVSNPYLSQIERGLHEPSVRVLKAIAQALNLSAETLLARAGLLEDDPPGDGGGGSTEAAIRDDANLTEEQRTALLAVYHSYVAANR